MPIRSSFVLNKCCADGWVRTQVVRVHGNKKQRGLTTTLSGPMIMQVDLHFWHIISPLALLPPLPLLRGRGGMWGGRERGRPNLRPGPAPRWREPQGGRRGEGWEEEPPIPPHLRPGPARGRGRGGGGGAGGRGSPPPKSPALPGEVEWGGRRGAGGEGEPYPPPPPHLRPCPARERGTGGGRCHDERAPARREGEERAPAEGEERAPARRSARLRARCARAWLPP